MPKAISPQEKQNSGAKSEDIQKPKSEALLIPDDQGLKPPSSSGHQEVNKMGQMGRDDQPKNGHIFGLSRSSARMQERKKVALYLGIAASVMVAVGAFVAYKCGSEPSCYHDEALGLY